MTVGALALGWWFGLATLRPFDTRAECRVSTPSTASPRGGGESQHRCRRERLRGRSHPHALCTHPFRVPRAAPIGMILCECPRHRGPKPRRGVPVATNGTKGTFATNGNAIDSIGVRRPPCRSPCSRARTAVWVTVADQAGVVEGTGEGCLQTPYVNHVLSTTRSCVGTPLGRGLDTRGDREFQEI